MFAKSQQWIYYPTTCTINEREGRKGDNHSKSVLLSECLIPKRREINSKEWRNYVANIRNYSLLSFVLLPKLWERKTQPNEVLSLSLFIPLMLFVIIFRVSKSGERERERNVGRTRIMIKITRGEVEGNEWVEWREEENLKIVCKIRGRWNFLSPSVWKEWKEERDK